MNYYGENGWMLMYLKMSGVNEEGVLKTHKEAA